MRLTTHPVIAAASVLAVVLLIPFGYVASGKLGLSTAVRPWFAIGLGMFVVTLANMVLPVIWRWVQASTKMTTFFMHYSAERHVSLSHVQAMISAGDYVAASSEIDILLATHGLDAGLCQLAVSHHLGKFGSSSRAEALLRRMRSEQPEQWEEYATQRLIDLYMRQSDTHQKAMTELRRLIARFPGTPEAAGAVTCLERLRLEQTPRSLGV